MSADKGNIAVHKHCAVCGKSMDVSQNLCSAECEQDFLRRRRSQQRRSWIFIGVLMGLMLLWLLLAGRAKP